jgi:hypothetical protein
VVLTQCEPVCEEWERVAVGRWGRDGRPRVRRAPRRVLGMDASEEAGCQSEVTAGRMKKCGSEIRSAGPWGASRVPDRQVLGGGGGCSSEADVIGSDPKAAVRWNAVVEEELGHCGSGGGSQVPPGPGGRVSVSAGEEAWQRLTEHVCESARALVLRVARVLAVLARVLGAVGEGG